jgi:hypothetical protein
VVIPEGIVDTLWFEVEERCREFGDVFDTWQDGLGQAILGLRDDGTFAATVGGITLSIPRQVAKTFIVGRIVVALCSMFPDLTVLWTAHRGDTATMTFQRLKAVVMRPAVKGYLRAGSNLGTAIRDANGEQQIPFANGSVIMFGAREFGFGRGFDRVDVEVFDEAQILTEKALEDMIAATNQSLFAHGALLFYMGTPPRPSNQSEAFTLRRDEALALKHADPLRAEDFGGIVEAGDAVFVECSADANVGRPGGPDLDDLHQVEKGNPSYPLRTPLVSIKRLRKNLPSDDSWRREGLGVWDEETSVRALISSALWELRRVEVAPVDGRPAYGVKFSPDGARVSLAAAVRQDDDDAPVHVEVVKSALTSVGTKWLVDWLRMRWRSASVVVIDGKSGAGTLVDKLRAAGVPARVIVVPTLEQVITAHGTFLDDTHTGGLTHYGQEGLTTIVEHATKRPIGPRNAGGWGWQGIGDDVDVTPLDAVTMAHHGARTSKRKPATRAGEGRRAVIM